MKRPKFPIIKDWPKKGVNFIDIMPLFSDMGYRYEVSVGTGNALDKLTKGDYSNLVIMAVDGRGLIVGSMLADNFGIPLIAFRDVKKIPQTSAVVSFKNEYSKERRFSVDAPTVPMGDFEVIIVDDIVATGKTIDAAEQWIKKMNLGNGRHITYLGSIALIHLTNLGYKNKKLKTLWKMKE